jgi:hypothetical protein
MLFGQSVRRMVEKTGEYKDLDNSIGFLNIMTCDLMKRPDNVTQHRAGVQIVLDGLDAYIENGLVPHKAKRFVSNGQDQYG